MRLLNTIKVINHSALLIIVIIGLTVSCAPGNTSANPSHQTGNKPEVAITYDYIQSLGKMDFYGADYIVVLNDQGGQFTMGVEELTGEAVNDAKFNRDTTIQDAYNVKVKYNYHVDAPATGELVSQSTMAGEYIGDIYNDALSNGVSYMGNPFNKRALYNMLDIPYLSPDQSWWSELMYKQLRFNDKLFFTSGDIAPAYYRAASCLFVNLQVADDNAIKAEDIYSLVYEGDWTLDKLAAYSKNIARDLNGDGEMRPGDDMFGLISEFKELTAAQLAIGAGIHLSEVDESGNLDIRLNSEHTIAVLNKIKTCYHEVTASMDTEILLKEAFKNDKILFVTSFTGLSTNYRDMDSDFAILPMAKYDESQPSYVCSINQHEHAFIAIPLIQPDIEKTGFVTEVMEYLSNKQVRPTVYDITLKGKVARNPDSQRMLDLVFDTAYTDFNAIWNIGSSLTCLYNTVFKGYELPSAYARIENKMERSLEKFADIFE